MKGIICAKPGQLDQIKVVEFPTVEPKDHQVQIVVKAAALSISDFKPFSEVMKQGKVSFASKLLVGKKPFGGDIAGIVTKVGKGVTQFHPGDEVYASIGINGGCVESIVVDASKVCLKPTNLSFEEAAAIPTSGIVAMAACQKAQLSEGKEVLVYGASGGMGMLLFGIGAFYACLFTTSVYNKEGLEITKAMLVTYIAIYLGGVCLALYTQGELWMVYLVLAVMNYLMVEVNWRYRREWIQKNIEF